MLKQLQKINWTRLCLHTLLIALTTIKIIDWNILNANYGRSLSRTFTFLFGSDAMIESPDNNQFFTYDEFESTIEKVFSTYQTIQTKSVAQFSYGYRDQNNNVNCKDEPQPITSTTYYWSDSTHIHKEKKEIYNLNDLYLITYNSSIFYEHLDSFHLSFDLCNYQQQTYSFLQSSKCNYWEIHLHYRFIGQLYMEITIDSNMQQSCSSMSLNDSFADFVTVFEVIVIIASAVYVYFILKDIYIAIKLYFAVKAAHQRVRKKYIRDPNLCSKPEVIAAQYDWKEIPTGIKRSFHSYWAIFTLIGLIFAVTDSLFTLIVMDYRYSSFSSIDKAFLGLSCLFLWVTLLQFIYYIPSLYAMAVTVQTAVPRILAFLVGFLPVYFAFVFLGIALFGYKLGMFNSLALGSSSMFAFINGDSIRPILILMENRSYLAAILYGVIFILLSMYLLLNILIAIVEEAYFLSRKKSRFLEYLMWKNLHSVTASSTSALTEEELQATMQQQAMRPIDDEEDEREEDEDQDEEDEWIQNVYSSIYTQSTPKVSPQQLQITLAEEAAEMYILGKTHWEYSKMMDYLVEQLSTVNTND